MAYSRYRRNYRRRSRKAVPWYRKKYSVGQIASKALRGVNYIRGLVNSEMFKYDISSSASPSWGGTVVALTNIAQGDTDATRTGNSIYVRQLMLRTTVTYNTAAAAPIRVRLLLFIDSQQIGDFPPAGTDVLEWTGVANAPLSPLNSDTAGRFKILRSRIMTVYADKPIALNNWLVKLRHHVRYNGSTSSDIQKGGIYLLIVSNRNADVPNVESCIRVSYHDN